MFIAKIIVVLGVWSLTAGAPFAAAAECPSRPHALGTSRVLVVDPAEHKRVGTLQYPESLPLDEREVVLTFDDGPLGSYTARVLDALAAECVKATFFLVGRMAKADPALVQRIAKDGHTIGSHTQNHPMNIRFLPQAKVAQEIDGGIATISGVLAEAKPMAPFFRIPGLYSSQTIEDHAAGRGIMIWSADLHASDWERVGAQGVIRRALDRLNSKRRGILLLHDIQPATVLALPHLLKQLRERNYRIVHVVAASPEEPKTATDPQQWLPGRARAGR